MQFTGERFTPGVHGEIEHEHLHRYLFALQLCTDRDVLDLASGEGYGSALLAQVARTVVGVDIDAESVRFAHENYARHNLSFQSGSATQIPIMDASMDVVVSFETIEHLTDHDGFLREIKRVLKPGGLLILSSPDHDVYSNGETTQNQFHLKELTKTEFYELINSQFTYVEFGCQKAAAGSLILPDTDNVANKPISVEVFDGGSSGQFEQTPGLKDALYILAVASDSPVPRIRWGAYQDVSYARHLVTEIARLSDQLSAATRSSDQLSEAINSEREQREAREAEVGTLSEAITSERERRAAREAEVDALRRQLEQAHKELAAAQHSLTQMKRSFSWRATRPLRSIATQAKRLKPRKRKSGRRGFDPAWYLEQYSDVAAAGIDPLQHYLDYGRHEGRLGAPPRIDFEVVEHRYDPAKETVVVVSHEASRTGAPILALNIIEGLRTKYNVVAIVLGGGSLVDGFRNAATVTVGPVGDKHRLTAAVHPLVHRLCESYRPRYAIVNSIESREVLTAFEQADVATVLLVHEFAAYVRPLGHLHAAIEKATAVVYSAQLVWDSTVRQFPSLASRHVYIAPQGQVRIPRAPSAVDEFVELQRIDKAIRPETAPPGTVVVIGGGSVQIRKGVDVFVAVAATVLRAASATRFRFVWVGGGYDPINDSVYSTYLAEQIRNSALNGDFAILDEVSRLDHVYDEADIFLLSSRLDPFPNVAIDAMRRGMPLVCFEGASGIAEVLAQQPACRELVVPYFAIDLAAARILELGENPEYRRQVSSGIKAFAAQAFDMKTYTGRLDEVGRSAIAIKHQEAEDAGTIREDSWFDPEFFSYAGGPSLPRDAAISEFVRRHANGTLDRRPCPEFHPGIYAERHPELAPPPFVNPFARFIRDGKPRGDWCIPLITPANESARWNPDGLKVAVHLHLYYPELAGEFIRALSVNRAACDLFLSTSKAEHVPVIEGALGSYRAGRVEIRIVPNRGRDVGPLLTAFGETILAGYDVFGHLHSKRSLVLGDQKVGETWRTFCREHLLGAQHPMMDLILKSFAEDPKLGLVLPSDPHLWPVGQTEALDRLASRLCLSAPIPQHLFYPLGTMFWARTAALASLFELGLGWEDYPPEPLPYDGTLLHAIERLVTLVVRDRGFELAATHVPGVGR
jgi:SAM-dependent methyltransferase/glycosyltransferase involved in cell wall biosynthesis